MRRFLILGQSFNTQPRGGGCLIKLSLLIFYGLVSIHSRAEAAARSYQCSAIRLDVSIHSRAEAAASAWQDDKVEGKTVSIHSRAEAAAT